MDVVPRPAERSRFVGGVPPASNELRHQPLKIALIVDLAPRKLGSIEDWLIAIGREARSRGHQVDLFCRGPVHPVVAERLAGLQVRVIHDVARAAAESPLQLRRTFSGYDVLQVNFFALRSRTALLAYAATPARVVYVDHGSRSPAGNSGLKGALSAAANRMALSRISTVVGVSDFVRRRDVDRFKLDETRARTVHNGVDVERFKVLPPPPADPFRVLAVAHLIPEKGIDVLLKALARMRHPAVLDVVGDGAHQPALAAMAEHLGIRDRVRFLGLRDDVQELIAASHVFVHPALWTEAFGLTIAEAMACGRPVIASRIGGIPEVIEDGSSGILFTPGDCEELAGHLDALASNPTRRGELGAEARARVERRFSLARSALEHTNVLEQVGSSEPLFGQP